MIEVDVSTPKHPSAKARVDESDTPIVVGRKWSACQYGSVIYAARTEIVGGARKRLFLHREIVRPPAGMVVDHMDGDGLNNVRSNLRICTQQQNACNLRHRARRTPRGVFYLVESRGWKAYITANGKRVNLGVFATEAEAAAAFNVAAKDLHGDFAVLNDVPCGTVAIPRAMNIGTKNPSAKLTEAGVAFIRQQAVAGSTQREIAAALGMSQSAVADVLRGVTWRHIDAA